MRDRAIAERETVRISRLVRFGLIASLVAWSGLLFAEGTGRVADDMGGSTPRRHAPPRRTPKKKRGKEAKPRRAPDAGAIVAASPPVTAAGTTSRDAGAEGGSPPSAGAARVAVDEEDEGENDEDDDDASAGIDSGAARPARPRRGDGGADASTEQGEDDDEDEESEEDEDTAYELGLELAAESRLVWRGLAESRGAVLQTSGWAGLYGLSVEGFASYLLNYEGPFSPTHVIGADLIASYAFSIGDLRFGPAVTLLYFPEGLSSSATTEVSLVGSYRLGEFRIVSGTNIDVSIEPGAYFGTLGVSWGRGTPPWTIKAVADVGWATGKYNFEYLGRNVTALDVAHAGASARYDLGDVFYVELHVDASRLLAPTLVGSAQEPTILVGGAAVGIDWSVRR